METTQNLVGQAGIAGEDAAVGLYAIALGIVIAVAFQRLGELIIARRNTAALKARGWIEAGAGHYPLMVGLHAGWLVACGWAALGVTDVSWWLIGVFVLLQGARVAVIASLGPYWTTRILTHAQAPLLRRGLYRHVRHPNYWIVAAEIAVLPLAFGAWEIALAFSLANAALLRHRVRVEEAANAGRPEAR